MPRPSLPDAPMQVAAPAEETTIAFGRLPTPVHEPSVFVNRLGMYCSCVPEVANSASSTRRFVEHKLTAARAAHMRPLPPDALKPRSSPPTATTFRGYEGLRAKRGGSCNGPLHDRLDRTSSRRPVAHANVPPAQRAVR